MTARYIPCHKCFPKASTSVTLSADKKKKKTSPQTSDEVCLLLFLNVSTISGWLVRHHVLAMSAVSLPPRACPCVCVGGCVCGCLCRFEYIYVLCAAFSSLPAWSRGKKAMSFFHNLIRGYTQERAAAAWTSLIMLMRSPGYVVIEV